MQAQRAETSLRGELFSAPRCAQNLRIPCAETRLARSCDLPRAGLADGRFRGGMFHNDRAKVCSVREKQVGRPGNDWRSDDCCAHRAASVDACAATENTR